MSIGAFAIPEFYGNISFIKKPYQNKFAVRFVPVAEFEGMTGGMTCVERLSLTAGISFVRRDNGSFMRYAVVNDPVIKDK